MNEDEIKLAVLTDPLEPKRLRLSDGQEFDVRAGSIAIGRRVCGVVVDGLIHTIANIHITTIAPVVATRK